MISQPAIAPSDPAVYLVAIDGTPAADHVIEVACGLGAALGGAAELHVLHVVGLLPPEAVLLSPSLVTPPDSLDAPPRTFSFRTSACDREKDNGTDAAIAGDVDESIQCDSIHGWMERNPARR